MASYVPYHVYVAGDARGRVRVAYLPGYEAQNIKFCDPYVILRIPRTIALDELMFVRPTTPLRASVEIEPLDRINDVLVQR